MLRIIYSCLVFKRKVWAKMDKIFVCEISENVSNEILGIFEMRNTLESLIRQIAENNDILEEDSTLYARLVEDYKENTREYNAFWSPYLLKYNDILDDNHQLTVDFRERKIYVTPKVGCV